MDAVFQKISSKLGPKWVLLITKLNFLSPRRRYDIEARYRDTKVASRAVVFKNCALDCIKEWVETEPVRSFDDEWKIKKLLYELRKIDDFVSLVEEIAFSEDIDLSDESAFHVSASGSLDSHVNELTSTKESAETGETCLGISAESTTRSALTEFADTDTSGSLSSSISPLLSPADMAPPTWLYGDGVSESRETLETTFPSVEAKVKPKIRITADDSRVETSGEKGMQDVLQVRVESAREDVPWRVDGREDFLHSASGEVRSKLFSDGASAMESEAGSDRKQRALVERGLDELSLSEGGSATSIAGSQDSAAAEVLYAVSIQMSIRRHKFAILDVSQRLSELKWRDIGARLDLDEVFLGRLTKECAEERYYLMLKKWVELSEGRATFSQLHELLAEVEEDSALLVLEARLNSKGRILIRAVHYDL